MKLPDSFCKHGTFLYNIPITIENYGSMEKMIEVMKKCDMSHAWIRVHGKYDSYGDHELNSELVSALMENGIAVAAWGWCQGEDIDKESELAVEATRELDLVDYVADIEEGVSGSHWKPEEVRAFLSKVRGGLPKSGGLAVSSHGFIDWHTPRLMKAADEIVDAFAPQVYWFWFPNSTMRNQFGEYKRDNPSEYARLCLDRWQCHISKPIIITGQAYWRESGMSQESSERKVRDFLSEFSEWDRIVGLNWWHFGSKYAAMSVDMQEAISEASISEKFSS